MELECLAAPSCGAISAACERLGSMMGTLDFTAVGRPEQYPVDAAERTSLTIVIGGAASCEVIYRLLAGVRRTSDDDAPLPPWSFEVNAGR